MSKIILSILLIFFSLPHMVNANLCSDLDEKMPVQSGGRIKPLFVVAKENMEFMLSQKPDLDVTTLFCLLSTQTIDRADLEKVLIKVEHPDAKKFLGIAITDKGVSPSLLISKEEDLRREYFARKKNDALKKEYNKILLRLQTFTSIISGQAWTIPNEQAGVVNWEPIEKFLSQDAFANTLKTLQTNYQNNYGTKHLVEFYYFKTKPFTIALCLALLAGFALILFPSVRISLSLTTLLLILQIAAISIRVYISGRAPITNMYETVVFSGFGALVISLTMFLIKNERIYLLAGIGYNFLTLLMINFANNMLSPSIAPLVPVLRDNFWLSTHVTTVILSYAALALSWMLANLVMLQKITNKKLFAHYQEKQMTPLIHNCVKVGVVLLAAGVTLGGIWADYSWGRFWGWDPKETWSLIVLLVYIAILHGKHTSWITSARFVPLIALAFLSVMMAWFGVNYILASGLHSYGFSEGGAIFLGSFFTAQFIVLFLNYTKAKVPVK